MAMLTGASSSRRPEMELCLGRKTSRSVIDAGYVVGFNDTRNSQLLWAQDFG